MFSISALLFRETVQEQLEIHADQCNCYIKLIRKSDAFYNCSSEVDIEVGETRIHVLQATKDDLDLFARFWTEIVELGSRRDVLDFRLLFIETVREQLEIHVDQCNCCIKFIQKSEAFNNCSSEINIETPANVGQTRTLTESAGSQNQRAQADASSVTNGEEKANSQMANGRLRRHAIL
jgi:hypothetical protein